MDHYIDIQLRPDPEFRVDTLMGALFSKLHRALAHREETSIGISFPAHALKPTRTLGNVLRLHANAAQLQALMAEPWLTGMRDHVTLSEMAPVPDRVEYCIVRRRQFKTNAERLRRRRAMRHGETMEQASEHIPVSVERKVKLPYIALRSQSSGHTFDLFVEHGPPRTKPIDGTFNSYGLSQGATVPWF